MTLAIFQFVGTDPVSRLGLRIWVIDGSIEGRVTCRHLGLMSLGPDDFLESSVIMIVETSSVTVVSW